MLQYDLFTPDFTTCENCGRLVHQDVTHHAFYVNNEGDDVLDEYCSQRCKAEGVMRHDNV